MRRIRKSKRGSASPKRSHRTPTAREAARLWVATEDATDLRPRTARLLWLAQKAPAASSWTFPGGWLSKYLFEEARYCFVYGQFIAATFLGFAFVERTVAAMSYATGRDDLERATSQKLIAEAVTAGWLRREDAQIFEKARVLRNPLVHFPCAWSRRSARHARASERRASIRRGGERCAGRVGGDVSSGRQECGALTSSVMVVEMSSAFTNRACSRRNDSTVRGARPVPSIREEQRPRASIQFDLHLGCAGVLGILKQLVTTRDI